MAQTIAVVDYGMGNLHSVSSALAHVAPDDQILVTADPTQVQAADRVVFPGVGAIRDCMAEIRRLGFDVLVRSEVASGKPVLGVCVGMQALMNHSEENGGVDCIGLVDGEVKFFGEPLLDAGGQRLKVPHMGWNQVAQTEHPLWAGIENMSRFYFVHSYYVQAADPTLVVGHTHYGVDCHVALARDNLFAVQFHPEKSHTAGLQLLKNFVNWRA
ncbi:imidazole glycerol phosphate synthase subunit HisH [Simiduia agarivorans]|uniref:Imidazole glycerol phosphate synthase subunit HisH n=1 Tax=Simiduia agarivorans (strain DSM 21679 / JCM 13881 / BCRC 17597 / SA1) TaxID=1117647 RepID=K4L1E0_SIMAS|nr:imidazole glycerol phosphate synthase subunit HisH [Simiduia agarivorans]AFU99992.1 imidazole glycerol phosphate synthase, glutamine amidotransferase subunit [Simiduia agarivorans SA1 = DSM 21679]